MKRHWTVFLSLFTALLLLLWSAVSCDSGSRDSGPDSTNTVGPISVPISGGGVRQSEHYRTRVSVGHVGTVSTGSQRYKTTLTLDGLTKGTR